MMGLHFSSGYSSPSGEFHWVLSALAGIVMCKIVYELTGVVSDLFFKGYAKLSDSEKLEWNNRWRSFPIRSLFCMNIMALIVLVVLSPLFEHQWLLFFRGFSTFHALVVASASFYLILLSDLFDESLPNGLMINKRSTLSNTILGISVGYFLSDLAMILWQFPALGGMEYVFHHGLSMFSIFLSLVSGQGQVYILMVLFTESTTPFVNLRWYLDIAGRKNSRVYIINGVALFLGWLAARILLFIFFFYHMFTHFDQVKKVFPLGFYSLLAVPPVLAMMNLFWFWKITKGMLKTLSKAKHTK